MQSQLIGAARGGKIALAMRMLIAILLVLPCLAVAQDATAPAPAPEPRQAPLGSDILPPLSLSDAQWLCHRAQLILSRQETSEAPEEVRLVRLMLQATIDYTQLAGRRMSSLADYTFTYVNRGILDLPNESVVFIFDVEPPIAGVQALALQSTRAPVMVETIDVDTAQGETLTLRPAQLLNHNTPGRSFLYLPELVTVSRITISASTESEERPRLRAWLGQTAQPEYLRQALAHLQEGRGALDDGDLDRAAAEIELARQQIALAETE